MMQLLVVVRRSLMLCYVSDYLRHALPCRFPRPVKMHGHLIAREPKTQLHFIGCARKRA